MSCLLKVFIFGNKEHNVISKKKKKNTPSIMVILDHWTVSSTEQGLNCLLSL